MIKIRTAENTDAAALALIFREDLGEPDCTQEFVEKKLLVVDQKRECVFVAQDDAEYMRINSGESRKDAHQFYHAQGCGSEKMQVRFLKELK